MSERAALLLAAGLHLGLLLLLSLGLAKSLPPRDSDANVTPVELVDIGEEARVTEPPKPSMEAAPREPGLPPAALQPVETPLAPAPPQSVAKPLPTPDDLSPQDALAEEVKPAPPRKATAPAKAKPDFDAGALASLIDKSKPEGPKPRETSAFSKSIEQAIPKAARLSPIAMATLEQAIRAQIAPCWNPPIGGADVQGMTAVLKIRLNRDGSVAAPPEFVSQSGATAGNQAYARAFVETARRAVLRCAPLDLPGDLYPHWREFELNFDPRLMT